MSTRYYPLFQRGNPQLRIFLPNFWMKIVRPEEPILPNQVLFQTSIEMTKYDVRNYLEKIYKIPIVDIVTTIKMGEIRRCQRGKNFCLVKDDDYKEALVTMPKDCTFEFPNVCELRKETKESVRRDIKMYDDLKKDYKENAVKTQSRHGIPSWFKI